MKKYQVWHDEIQAKDYIIRVEVDTLQEAEIALRALAAYSFNLNHSLIEEFPNKDPLEFSKEHSLGGIMINKDGEFVDL